MYIGIDSSNQIKYTGVVSGSFSDIDKVYNEIQKILKVEGVNPPYHWSKISRKVKDKTKNKVIESLNKSKLKFNIFLHKKTINIPRKEFYYFRIPRAISQNLENWLNSLKGSVEIEVDNDYNIKNHSTEEFIESLVQQIGFRLIGKPVKVRKEDKVKASIKQNDGGLLNLYGVVTDSKSSKGIQIIDITLGIFIERDGTNNKSFDKNRLFFREI